MRQKRILGDVALVGLISALVVGAGSALAGSPRMAGQGTGVAPRTWHVIAGFTQAIPTGSGNTEMVNQFYPRTLTIYQGDAVTWTTNAASQAHTVTFGPDALLRPLETPQHQVTATLINGKQAFLLNPAVFFPSARGPLVETDTGAALHLLNCGQIGPPGAPTAPSCTVTFPHVGAYSYDCLFHAGIPGNADMDGVIRVIPRPQALAHHWTVLAGTGTATDEESGFFPSNLTIHVGDSVIWRSGGEHFHTVSFGLDPFKTPLAVPMGADAHGAPILAFNPRAVTPIMPTGGVYRGGIASSGIFGLGGNYANLPGQAFLKAPFALTFGTPGVYTYYCLVHAPLMKGMITVLPAGA